MHLAFVDFIYHYDASRPDTDEPLGGTTSAICFLARELVKIGVDCTFFNRIAAPCETHAIKSLPMQALAEEIVKDRYDAYIFCGRWSRELVRLVRMNTRRPLVGWMHESMFRDPVTPALAEFDGMVYVSEWQKRVNQALALAHWQQAVIRNAMNPLVADSFAAGPILSAKATPPVLLFAGSFARGAFHVPPILDKLRAIRSDFEVELFCNLDPSGDAEKDKEYIAWLRAQPDIAHVGMVGQPELARRMRRAAVMMAPNPWPETSCIALIEGLASGLMAVATDRAALPETAGGFAQHIHVEGQDEMLRFDMPVDYDAFAAAIDNALRMRESNAAGTEARLREQVDYFRANYQWPQRAAPWADFIQSLRPSS